jgi:Cu-Zn family superoxide dismutase
MGAVAVAVFDTMVKGTVVFKDSAAGTIVTALFTQLPSGQHGFHIHTNGDLREEGCMGACAHFHKGPPCNHGGPPGSKGSRHTGDLGNVSETNFVYRYRLKGVRVNELLGRTVIVHADPDDLGLGGQPDSLVTGHAGKRIACALIGRASCRNTRKNMAH